nr:retrovirus-related Pol polyprotein from transposon TNT 1-94 [Tanacetum cinerariifolium]
MPKCKIFETASDSSVSEINKDNNQAKDRYTVGIGYHVVLPPCTGNYMPPRADISFAGLDDSVFKFKIIETRTSVNENESIASKSSEEIREEPKTVRVVERKNRTLIEVARTMLSDSLLPTTFWAEAVNTACYVQNRVLVTKPHNKTPYELLIGRSPDLECMRPFGCPVTILNTLDHLGKFDDNADKGFLVGYSINIFVGNQSNGDVGIQTEIHAGQASQEKAAVHEYILLPFIPSNPPLSSSIQSSDVNAGAKPRDVNVGDKLRDVNPGDIQGDVDEISRNDDVCQGNEIRINRSTHAVNAASLSINIANNIIDAGSHL